MCIPRFDVLNVVFATRSLPQLQYNIPDMTSENGKANSACPFLYQFLFIVIHQMALLRAACGDNNALAMYHYINTL